MRGLGKLSSPMLLLLKGVEVVLRDWNKKISVRARNLKEHQANLARMIPLQKNEIEASKNNNQKIRQTASLLSEVEAGTCKDEVTAASRARHQIRPEPAEHAGGLR